MSRQAIGEFLSIPNIGASMPTGTQGRAMADFTDGRKPRQWRLKVKVSAAGAFSVNVQAVGRDAAADWGTVGPLDGDINGGAALDGTTAGTWYFDPTNLGILTHFGLLLVGATGAPTVTAELAAIFEGGD